MATQPSDSDFSARLFFTVFAVLVVIAGGTIAFVLWKKAGRAEEPLAVVDAGAVEHLASSAAPPTTPDARAAVELPTDDGAVIVASPVLEPDIADAPENNAASPTAPTVPAAADESLPPPPATASPPALAALGKWRHGAPAVSASPFGYEEPGVESRGRRALVAPAGQQYVTVAIHLEWAGGGSRRINLSDAKAPTVRLADGDRRWNPLGRRVEPVDPWRPWQTESFVLKAGNGTGLVLVFLLPDDVASAVVEIEAMSGPAIAIPPPPALDAAGLAGRWQRSDRLLDRVRFDDAILDAMLAPESRLLLVDKAAGGGVSLSFPSIGVSGSGKLPGDGKAGALSLKHGGQSSPVRLRLVEDGNLLLVYVGAEGKSAVLYQVGWAVPTK